MVVVCFLEIVIQPETGSCCGEVQAEAFVAIEIALVVTNESKAEGGSPVFGGHPSDARLKADSVAEFLAGHVKVASQVHHQGEFLNAADGVTNIGGQNDGMGR